MCGAWGKTVARSQPGEASLAQAGQFCTGWFKHKRFLFPFGHFFLFKTGAMIA
jgi:hypothetical protein